MGSCIHKMADARVEMESGQGRWHGYSFHEAMEISMPSVGALAEHVQCHQADGPAHP